MSSSKKKIVYSIIITIIAVLGTMFIVNAYQKGDVKYLNGYETLKTSREFYCMEHQDGLTPGIWQATNSVTYTSDDPNVSHRILAKILYDSKKAGQGGYYQDHGGAFQVAVWKCLYYDFNINKSLSGLEGRDRWNNIPSIYQYAKSAAQTPIPYTTNASKSDILILADNKMTINGNTGSITVKKVTGSIKGIEVTWKDPTDNKEYKQTINANTDSVKDWVELYKDKECKQKLNLNEIKDNTTIYIKNLKINYLMSNVKVNAGSSASGYAVEILRWKKTTGSRAEQDLLSATIKEGQPIEKSINVKPEYSYGEIRIEKVGVYTQDGVQKEEEVSATFKLYCSTLNKWVKGNADGTKTYVDKMESADSYDSNTTIKGLFSTFQYQLVEVKVNNAYYNNPIKMVSAESNLQKGLKVVEKDKYYSTSEVEVYANKTNLVVVKNEKTSRDLIIHKVGEITKNDIEGVSFKIYAENNGWVVGDKGKFTYSKDINDATTYTTDSKGIKKLNCLKIDTYHVYETASPREYALEQQKGYMNNNGKDPYSFSKDNKWVYLGKTVVNEDITFEVENKRTTGNLTIIKEDKDTKERLPGVTIQVFFKEKGWLIQNNNEFTYTQNAKEATSFVTDDKGEIRLEELELGKYSIYETKSISGYDITKQEGYMKDEISKANEWVYLGDVVLSVENNKDNNFEFKFEAENLKIINIEGHVWLDNPNGKLDDYNYIFDGKKWENPEEGTAGDKLLEGIDVYLWSNTNNEKPLAGPVKTDPNGYYKFENIKFVDAKDAYVEFIYNNKEYIVVDTLVGNDKTINSKAKEHTMTTNNLDDNKLTGEGHAVTEKKNDVLTSYFEADTYSIKDINLGLMTKHNPAFTVSENLEYVKVKMNGYTYTYKYGEDPAVVSEFVPKTALQNSKTTYTATIYPTDVAYNAETKTDELKVYVVYKVGVTNEETTDKDDLYVEKTLYLEEFTNTFDSDRYELSTEENGNNEVENKEFKLWSASDNNAKYTIEGSAFENGIKPRETKNSYIQFRVKDDAVQKLLSNDRTNTEKAPTVANAKVYHEYLRTDNVWVDDEKVVAFDGVKGTEYESKNSNNEKYYVHKSISQDDKSSDLYIDLELADSRKLSGVVFEDSPVNPEKSYLGNGQLDNNENRGQNVKVELLDSNKKEAVSLYQVVKDKDSKFVVKYDESGKLPKAVTVTDKDGKYEFDGVVPGYYYIRFTYGDGTQKIVDLEGKTIEEKVKVKDYKSTIISNDVIKNANEVNENEKANFEDKQKVAYWYKNAGNSNYSTAVDDMVQRKSMDGYIYKDDGKVYQQEGDKLVEVTDYDTKTIEANTPMLGISIENDVDDSTGEKSKTEHKNEFNGFNFGLIKQPSEEVKVEKKITNVKFINQVGTTLVSENPADKKTNYLTALDNITGGSKYAKLELEEGLIYGSNVEVTYEISVTNYSKVDYNNDRYYKYGEDGTPEEIKKVDIVEVRDDLDEKYNFESLKEESTSYQNFESGSKNFEPVIETIKDEDGKETTNKYIKITGWDKIASGETTTKSYTVTALVANDGNDPEYENSARVQSLKLDTLSTFNTSMSTIWEREDKTTLTITPNTGENRNVTYYIVGAIALVVIAGGIVLIKKKVIK